MIEFNFKVKLQFRDAQAFITENLDIVQERYRNEIESILDDNFYMVKAEVESV